MAKTLMQASFVNGGSNTTANTDGYWPLSGHLESTQSTTEANNDIKFQQAGTLANLYVRVQTNSIAGSSTIITRKNAADGGQSITVGSSATGEFEDNSGSDTIAAGDKLCLKFHPGAATNTMNVRVLCATFNATTDTVTVPVLKGPFTTTTASTTWFLPLQGHSANLITTETNMKCRMRKSGTLKKYGVYVSANRATNSTVRIRKNGANGNGVITITGGGASGWYEDTSNTDTVSAGEDWNWSVTSGTGADTLTIQTIKCEFNSTAGDGFTCIGKGTGTTVADATASYYPLGGTCDTTGTESVCQSKARVAFTYSNMEVMVSQNDVSSASTCDLRKGAASTAVTVSITGSLTGLFEDTTHSVTVVTGDEMAIRLNVPSVAGTHTVTLTNVVIHTNAPNDYTRAPATETVSVSDTITRLLAATRANTETTSSTETLNRGGSTFNRALATETTTITDQLDKLRTVVRPLATETVTSSESIARKLDAIRNPVESTTSSETLARMIAANRSTATESVSISDSISRIKELPRSCIETITVTDSLARMLASNRTLSETTTISDSVSRLLTLNRALATETTTITDSLNRLLAATRTNTETTTISDSVVRTVGRVRAIATETVTISDSIVRMIAANRTLSENVIIAEQLTRLLAATRALTDTIVITDSVSRTIQLASNSFSRSISETVTISDSVVRQLAATRTLANENISILDTIARLLNLNRSNTETTTSNESLGRTYAANRSVSDNITISDSIVRIVGRIRTLVESVSIVDSITRRFVGTRPIQEIVDISDSLSRIITRFQIPTRLHNLKEYIIANYQETDPSL